MNSLVNVMSFTNKVPVQKATFCHSITAVCHHNVNVKMTIIYIPMGNAINSTPKVYFSIFDVFDVAIAT